MGRYLDVFYLLIEKSLRALELRDDSLGLTRIGCIHKESMISKLSGGRYAAFSGTNTKIF